MLPEGRGEREEKKQRGQGCFSILSSETSFWPGKKESWKNVNGAAIKTDITSDTKIQKYNYRSRSINVALKWKKEETLCLRRIYQTSAWFRETLLSQPVWRVPHDWERTYKSKQRHQLTGRRGAPGNPKRPRHTTAPEAEAQGPRQHIRDMGAQKGLPRRARLCRTETNLRRMVMICCFTC